MSVIDGQLLRSYQAVLIPMHVILMKKQKLMMVVALTQKIAKEFVEVML